MAQSENRRVFLSAVSSEFERARSQVATDLRTREMQVKMQEDFRLEPGAETTLQKLHYYIHNCCAVVCVIGTRSGSMPPVDAAAPYAELLPPGFTRASYAQWEFLFARWHRRRFLLYHADDDYEPDHPEPTQGDDPELQSRFVRWLFQEQGLDRESFSSVNALRALVLRQDWPPQGRNAVDLASDIGLSAGFSTFEPWAPSAFAKTILEDSVWGSRKRFSAVMRHVNFAVLRIENHRVSPFTEAIVRVDYFDTKGVTIASDFAAWMQSQRPAESRLFRIPAGDFADALLARVIVYPHGSEGRPSPLYLVNEANAGDSYALDVDEISDEEKLGYEVWMRVTVQGQTGEQPVRIERWIRAKGPGEFPAKGQNAGFEIGFSIPAFAQRARIHRKPDRDNSGEGPPHGDAMGRETPSRTVSVRWDANNWWGPHHSLRDICNEIAEWLGREVGVLATSGNYGGEWWLQTRSGDKLSRKTAFFHGVGESVPSELWLKVR